jgi:predicted NACHT family NTPase
VNLARLTQPVPDEGDEHRQPWGHGTLLPVVILLRDFAAAALPAPGSRGRASHLWDFISEQLGSADLAAYAPVLRRRLLNEGGLLLLDGLDEVPETGQRRLQVKRAIEDFAGSYDRCRVLVTSRTFPYQSQDWRLQAFEEAILAPFTDAQIRRSVDRWYAHAAALGRLSREDAAGRAALLQDAVFRRGRLLGLARRPLLLTLIASLHAWRGGNLPEKRERLYADTVDLLLDFWEQRRLRRDAEGNPVVLQPSIAE